MAPLFLSVQDAYDVLSDPARRAAYDRELSRGGYPERQPPPAASSKPERDYTHRPHASPREQTEPPADPAPALPSEQDLKRRRIKVSLLGSLFAILAGYWMFQLFQLGQIMQEDNGLRMFSPQGTPAVAYGVLWAIGTAIASMADDWMAAVKSPLICAG